MVRKHAPAIVWFYTCIRLYCDVSREQAWYCRVAVKQASSLTHTPSSGIEISYNVCDDRSLYPRRLADQTVMWNKGETKEVNNGSSNYPTLATRMGELGPRMNAAYFLTLCEWYGWLLIYRILYWTPSCNVWVQLSKRYGRWHDDMDGHILVAVDAMEWMAYYFSISYYIWYGWRYYLILMTSRVMAVAAYAVPSIDLYRDVCWLVGAEGPLSRTGRQTLYFMLCASSYAVWVKANDDVTLRTYGQAISGWHSYGTGQRQRYTILWLL